MSSRHGWEPPSPPGGVIVIQAFGVRSASVFPFAARKDLAGCQRVARIPVLIYMDRMSNARNILFVPAALPLPLALGRLLLSCP